MVARPTRKRVYRTMQGRMVDIEKLRAANEDVRAIGNMSVNARGDIIDRGGHILKSKAAVMKEYYEAPKGRADDRPSRAKRVSIPQRKVTSSKVINPQPRQVVGATTQFKPKVVQPQPSNTPKKGIDAALDGIE